MRVAIYVALLVACVAAAPDLTRAALASAASVVLETLPYVAAAALLKPLLGRFAPAAVAYAGCGCSAGPGARSVPSAVACATLFGPHVALARWLAASAIAAILRKASAHEHHDDVPLLTDVTQLAPAALLAGVLNTFAPMIALGHVPAVVQFIAGIALGFAGSPCALGAVALASALHGQSPIASSAVLCVAGIADLRVWWTPRLVCVRGDRVTFALLALACGIVANEHGATLVHPRMTVPLWGCAFFCTYLAVRCVESRSGAQRLAATTLVAMSMLGSPPPAYVATEATLDTLYPGEPVTFTGVYEPPRVIRYAITCCRADARPVAIQLADAVNVRTGSWLRVHGIVGRRGDALVVQANAIRPVAPPVDPFVYL